MAILHDLVDLAEVTGYARGAFIEEERNEWGLLADLLPTVLTPEIELRAVLADLVDEDEAVIRAWDTESQIVGRQGARRVTFELPPISRKSRIGEEERIRAVGLGRVGGDAQVIVNKIYDDAPRHARSIAARWARLRADALFDSAITLTETNDRVIQSVSYGRTGGHTVTASTLWTSANAATATPIDDLLTWQETYITTNGIAPAAIIATSKVLGGLLVNNQIKAVLQMPSGGPARVTIDGLQNALASYGLPPIITFDAQTRRAGTKTRLTNANKLLFVPPAKEPLGNFFVGPTAESLELVEAGTIAGPDAPGLAVVVEKTSDPVSIWTKVAGAGFPWVANPDLTFLATVTS